MKIRYLFIVMSVIFACMMFPLTISADTGPKPYVQVTFLNMDDEICYATLLSETKSTGPHSVWDGNDENRYVSGDDEYSGKVWEKFVSYEDSDGFYFLQFFERCDDTKIFKWGYFPPTVFKILLYFPETDSFKISGVYESYAFHSLYTVDMNSAGETLTAQRSYDHTWELISLGCRIVITLIIEILIALLFGYTAKKLILPIIIINIITQVLLNIALNIVNYYQGSMMFTAKYILYEIIVFAVEAVFYRIIFRKYEKNIIYGSLKIKTAAERIKNIEPDKEKQLSRISSKRTVLYAFISNLCSFAAGILLSRIIPGIF